MSMSRVIADGASLVCNVLKTRCPELATNPEADPDARLHRIELVRAPGLLNRPRGCEFRPRCPFAREQCATGLRLGITSLTTVTTAATGRRSGIDRVDPETVIRLPPPPRVRFAAPARSLCDSDSNIAPAGGLSSTRLGSGAHKVAIL